MSKNTKSCFCKTILNILENTKSIHTGLELFFEVCAPFLKTDVLLANFKPFCKFSFTNRFIQISASSSAKKLLLLFITFTGMSVACMTFELSNILISFSEFTLVIVLKEKYSLANSEDIAITHGCFRAFKVRWFMFFDKGSKFSKFPIV